MRNISRIPHPVNRAGDLSVANAQLHIVRELFQRQRIDLEQTNSVETTGLPAPFALPPHLGWEGDRVPSQLNRVPQRPSSKIEMTVIPADEDLEKVRGSHKSNVSNSPPKPLKTISVHPSMLLAFLKNEMAAIGRIWLLARSLDQNGRGWLAVDELRTQLTDKSSPLRVCGWRRLRQILNAGKGVFWERDDFGRIWLYSTLRIAKNLGVTHFWGDVIKLPIQELFGTIGDVRATFYTAFHCGRDASPISRATLQTVTGVPERTQRHYDDARQTERVSNFSFVAQAGDQEFAWQHGRAAFTFTDRQGKQGRVGESYTAIRLPNSYTSTRYASLTGKRKRLNHKLKQDLANHGTQGNSNEQVQRLFFTDGKQAGRVFGSSTNKPTGRRNNDVYVRDQQNGATVFWLGWLH